MPEQKNSIDQEEAKLLGTKLGIFIASMPVSDEAKQSLIDAALLLNEQELVELVTMLEVKYAEFETQDLNKKFEQDLLDIKNKFAAKRKALNQKTLVAMADLEKELDNL